MGRDTASFLTHAQSVHWFRGTTYRDHRAHFVFGLSAKSTRKGRAAALVDYCHVDYCHDYRDSCISGPSLGSECSSGGDKL